MVLFGLFRFSFFCFGLIETQKLAVSVWNRNNRNKHFFSDSSETSFGYIFGCFESKLVLLDTLPYTQEITGLHEVQSILPIPDNLARKFIDFKGLKNIDHLSGNHAAASEPIISGDETVKTLPELAANGSLSTRRQRHHTAAAGLQRILDLFGIKSLDQITSVIPIENIRELPPAHVAAAANAAGPSSAADTAAAAAASDPLAPIQKSLARENKAADLLATALKKHGDKIKAIQRVKRLHDVRRAEAIKRLEEVKQLLEVKGLNEIKSIKELKKVFPLSDDQATELKGMMAKTSKKRF